MRHHDPMQAHVSAVDALIAARVPAPAAWIELRDRLADLLRREHPCTDRLADAIVSGAKADVAVLRALALAEATATSVNEAEVTNVVRAAVHAKLVGLYSSVAHQNYVTVARRFDDAATKFLAAANVVDPESRPDEIVHLSEKQRLAWLSAADHAAALTELLPVLASAARLAGAPEATDDEAEIQLPLAVGNLPKLHKRRAFEAWAATGRCGRWSAIVALGGRIGAARHPDRLELCTPPRPFVQRFLLDPNTGRYQPKIEDPEDNPTQPVNDGTVEWSVA